MDCSPPGSSIRGIFQARVLERGAIAFSSLPAAAAAAKSLQSCPTLCDPIDGSPPGSPVPGILRARTLEWVAISFSNAWKWKVKVKPLSHIPLFATPWTAAYQAPPPMGFSRQEYWSGVPLPSLPSNMQSSFPQCSFEIFSELRRLLFGWIYVLKADWPTVTGWAKRALSTQIMQRLRLPEPLEPPSVWGKLTLSCVFHSSKCPQESLIAVESFMWEGTEYQHLRN